MVNAFYQDLTDKYSSPVSEHLVLVLYHVIAGGHGGGGHTEGGGGHHQQAGVTMVGVTVVVGVTGQHRLCNNNVFSAHDSLDTPVTCHGHLTLTSDVMACLLDDN